MDEVIFQKLLMHFNFQKINWKSKFNGKNFLSKGRCKRKKSDTHIRYINCLWNVTSTEEWIRWNIAVVTKGMRTWGQTTLSNDNELHCSTFLPTVLLKKAIEWISWSILVITKRISTVQTINNDLLQNWTIIFSVKFYTRRRRKWNKKRRLLVWTTFGILVYNSEIKATES